MQTESSLTKKCPLDIRATIRVQGLELHFSRFCRGMKDREYLQIDAAQPKTLEKDKDLQHLCTLMHKWCVEIVLHCTQLLNIVVRFLILFSHEFYILELPQQE